MRTARTDIMTLLGNGDESSDEHLVEGLRDGEVEVRLVPNLGLLHAADATLHSKHCDSTSKRLVQAGEHRTQVGAGDHTAVVLDDHLQTHKQLG